MENLNNCDQLMKWVKCDVQKLIDQIYSKLEYSNLDYIKEKYELLETSHSPVIYIKYMNDILNKMTHSLQKCKQIIGAEFKVHRNNKIRIFILLIT